MHQIQTIELDVADNHKLAVYSTGNPQGLPIIYLHGGPGAACDLKHFDNFDLNKVFLILHDQRSCGNSKPYGDLLANTTQHLVADINFILNHFELSQALIYGGSWGSTLALAYAEAYPEKVLGMVLRSICLAQETDHHWLYQFGANQLFPAAWQNFVNYIPANEQHNLVLAYCQRLIADDKKLNEVAALHWHNWACACLELPQMEAWPSDAQVGNYLLNIARIETHYFSNEVFLGAGAIMRDISRIQHIKTIIVHGQKDYLCPVANAYTLHQALPNSSLVILPDAGHLSSAPGMQEALQKGVKEFII